MEWSPAPCIVSYAAMRQLPSLEHYEYILPLLSTSCSLPLAKPGICLIGTLRQLPLLVSVAGSARKQLLPLQETSTRTTSTLSDLYMDLITLMISLFGLL